MSKFDPNATWWSTDPLVSSIREEINKKHPSAKKILSHLFSLQVDGSEFIDLAGRTLHLKPKFFMESLYTPFRNKLGTICGYEKRKEIEKSILEKFCLDKEEQIFFEFEGTVKKKVPNGYKIVVPSGTIFITKQRIITEGKFKTSSYKGERMKPTGADIATNIASSIPITAPIALAVVLSKKSPTPVNVKKAVLYYSIQEDSPCYGYVFPITFPRNLGTKKNSVFYDDEGCIMELSSPFFNERENVELLIDMLEEIHKELISEQTHQEDCPKCSLSRKIKLSRCSWCGKILHEE